MQQREKQLAIGLGSVVGLFVLWTWISSSVLAPLREKQSQLTAAKVLRDKRQIEFFGVARARKDYNEWTAISLPVDPPAPGARPNDPRGAIIAQRLYQQWVQQLCELCGFEQLQVQTPRRPISSPSNAVVPIQVTAQATHAQLMRFLELFRRTRLLQRVARARITSPEASGDPTLEFTLDLEGLALATSTPRSVLFPRTTLTHDMNDVALSLSAITPKEFPAKGAFSVLIGQECVAVTKSTANEWSIERGQLKTAAAPHALGSVVELWPLAAVSSESPANLFIKPAPPVEYHPQVEAPVEKVVLRGQSLQLSLAINGYDPARGKPRYTLVDGAPAGATLNALTGQFEWKPDSAAKAGPYEIAYHVAHPSASDGKLAGKLVAVLKEPNTPPVIELPATATVYLGRVWETDLHANDAESPVANLKWTLADPKPEGAELTTAGHLKWTIPETLAPGMQTVRVKVDDQGDPAMTADGAIPIMVAEDLARFTLLVGIVNVKGDRQAWLYDRIQDRKTIVRAGDELTVADVTGKVLRVEADAILVELPGEARRLAVGKEVSDLRTGVPQ